MPITQVQVRIPRPSGMTADTVVNTFHFGSTGTEIPSGDLAAVTLAIQRFYVAVTAGGEALVEYYANSLDLGNVNMRFYALSDPEPRVPYYNVTNNIHAARSSAVDLPAEVALCLSIAGDAVSGQSQARRRGRIYTGPFNTAAVGTNLGGDGRPVALLITTMQEAAQRLRNETTDAAVDADWVVYSRTGDSATTVTNGWVNNAWDTQRRRGAEASARNAFAIT